ncbi:hypothetical protein [Methylobacterium sp. 88A]|uniref:hypothetical protein n=1 Tax=Methylobacterium sp. 88A TaxID=1131813 RepID=UPI0003804134|nr:hypothetical protein [Methylobacterium sp. 88A]
MTLRSLITAAALANVTVGVATLPASAETIKPLDGGSVSLGELSGVAYYTAEPKGYRVVVTLARTGTSRAMRFETVLANGQSVTLSTPQELGGTADAVEISRTGDTVAVNRPRPDVTREAAAQN